MDIEWIILADSAEVINGKLYVMGGGWESLGVNSGFPIQQPCAIAAAFRVPWDETNQPHSVEMEIVDDDGHSLATVSGQIEAGRPPGIPRGQAQRVQIAVQMGLGIEKPGGYVIIGRVEGEEKRRVPFNVVAGPGLAMQGGGKAAHGMDQ